MKQMLFALRPSTRRGLLRADEASGWGAIQIQCLVSVESEKKEMYALSESEHRTLCQVDEGVLGH